MCPRARSSWTSFCPGPRGVSRLRYATIAILRRRTVLTKSQIRAGFKISRIRAFYTRKVKYTSETFTERLTQTIDAFPRLVDIHLFHRDLLNTLYDADHFRIALGQLSTAKSLIETVARDYVRLLDRKSVV